LSLEIRCASVSIYFTVRRNFPQKLEKRGNFADSCPKMPQKRATRQARRELGTGRG
jgi:hypothetical protein